MKKRIEEFTARELIPLYNREMGQVEGMQAVLNHIKSNLATTEPMSVEEIENLLHHSEWSSKKDLARIIQPLTGQGLRVDWSKAPEWAVGYVSFFTREPKHFCNFDGVDYDRYIPRHEMRQMNRQELVKALEGYASEFSDDDIKAMLAKRGISTEVPV
jgi:hypothetical protein